MMAWTAPMTAVANTAFTAAQFNTYVRDNLLCTAPALATTAGALYVGTGANAIAERIPASASVDAGEVGTLTSYGDLATPGPSVTVTTGTSALVCLYAGMYNTTGTALAGFQVAGATSVSPTDTNSIQVGLTQNTSQSASQLIKVNNLTAGINSFTMKYRVTAGSGSFVRRHLVVIPL